MLKTKSVSRENYTVETVIDDTYNTSILRLYTTSYVEFKNVQDVEQYLSDVKSLFDRK